MSMDSCIHAGSRSTYSGAAGVLQLQAVQDWDFHRRGRKTKECDNLCQPTFCNGANKWCLEINRKKGKSQLQQMYFGTITY